LLARKELLAIPPAGLVLLTPLLSTIWFALIRGDSMSFLYSPYQELAGVIDDTGEPDVPVSLQYFCAEFPEIFPFLHRSHLFWMRVDLMVIIT
jgi:hypothetical protein